MTYGTYECVVDGIDVQGDLIDYFWDSMSECWETEWGIITVFVGSPVHALEIDCFNGDFQQRAVEGLVEQAADDMKAGHRDGRDRRGL